MRRAAPRPIASVLAPFTAARAPATLLAEVQRHWEAAAGAFAEHALPVAERAGVVTVACDSAVWAQELQLLSVHVVERLNAALGRPAVSGLRPQARPRRP
jgi:predicted nucleic acid-binding Zn ribbon protein